MRAAYCLGVAARGAKNLITLRPFRRRRRRRVRGLLSGRQVPKRDKRARKRRDRFSNSSAPLPNSETASALARALSDPDPWVRATTLDMVGSFSDERAARIVARMLHDPDLDVRLAAARAAGRSKTSAVVFSLILALEDADEVMQEAAADAIEAITGRQVTSLPSGRDERQSAVEELKAWWKEQRYSELRQEVQVG